MKRNQIQATMPIFTYIDVGQVLRLVPTQSQWKHQSILEDIYSDYRHEVICICYFWNSWPLRVWVDWLEGQRKWEFLSPTVRALLCSVELELTPNVGGSSQKVRADEPEMQSGPYGPLTCKFLSSDIWFPSRYETKACKATRVPSGDFQAILGYLFLLENKGPRKKYHQKAKDNS